MKRGIFILIGLMSMGMSAQNLSESVTVEGRYQPEVIAADRIPVLPTALTLKVPDSPMSYDRNGVIAAFAPDALPMEATGWKATKAFDISKGYINVFLGSWLNSSLSAGYNAINTANTRLNIYLQHNSTSLWQAWKENAASGTPAADKRFRYDESIGANLKQRFDNAGDLTAALQYHFGYFNYYATTIGPVKNGRIEAPTQNLNDAYANLVWTGTVNENFTYSADADVRYFGYRDAYLPLPNNFNELAKEKGTRETAINIGGKMTAKTGKRGLIELGLRYSGVINSVGNDMNRGELLPSYLYTGKTFSMRFGLNAAVVGNGHRTQVRIAPDVMFSARKGILAFSAKAGGGTYFRTLAWAHMYDYYSDPGMGCHQAAYTPIDALMSFQLNPGGRWTFGIEGGWRTTLDETFGGYYQALLNNLELPENAFSESGKIYGFSLRANAGYKFNRYFALSGRFAWQPQDGSKGYFNGFDRAAITTEVSAESSPNDKLSIGLDYRLRAKRLLLPGCMSRLNLRGEYRITEKISVGLELNNLLNRHEEMLPGLALEGFNASAGLQITF